MGYRLVEDGPELVLEAFEDGEWKEEYGFVPDPFRWWTSR